MENRKSFNFTKITCAYEACKIEKMPLGFNPLDSFILLLRQEAEYARHSKNPAHPSDWTAQVKMHHELRKKKKNLQKLLPQISRNFSGLEMLDILLLGFGKVQQINTKCSMSDFLELLNPNNLKLNLLGRILGMWTAQKLWLQVML